MNRIPLAVVRLAVIACFGLPLSSSLLFAQHHARIATAPKTSSARKLAGPAIQCPDQGGVLDSISVPVEQPLTLYVLLDSPAPSGGAYFEVESEDPSIVAAGDTTQGFLPQVFVPEGEVESGPFVIFGIQTGSTYLDIIPETEGYGESSTPTTAWYVNPDDDGNPQTSVFLDANYPSNPCRADGSSTISTDPSVLSDCGGNVMGTVTDGVSQLLLRSVAGLAGTACYAITSTSDLDQGQITTAVTSTQSVGDDDFQYAFSFLEAPAEYGDNSDSRQIEVTFSFTPSYGNGNTSTIVQDVTVIRPPLLLIHGLWSSRDGFPAFWTRSGPTYVTRKMDYHNTNAASYDVNYPAVETEVGKALDNAHDLQYAATQVDVVGHSMGGLLTRLYAGSSEFERPENFDMGDVRRLVTLDTPHSGSTGANLIVSMTKNSTIFRALGDLLAGFRGVGFNNPVFNGGAVCDLAENSPALQDLSDSTDLPAHVITATGGPPGTANGGLYWKPLETALTLKVPFYVFPQSIVNDFRFRQQNDAIVALVSQEGGLTGTNFPSDIHTSVNTDPNVAPVAFGLLDGPSSAFTALPGVTSNGLGNPITVPGRGTTLDQQDYAAECAPGAPLKPASQAVYNKRGTQPGVAQTAVAPPTSLPAPADDSRVYITSPTSNQRFAPGDTVNVTVQLTAPLTASAAFIAPELAGFGPVVATASTGGAYQASFVIPDTYAGPLTIAPAILDSSQNPIRGITTTINVIPSSAPLSLTLPGGNYTHISSVPSTETIQVTGNYADNLTLDLSSSVTGTTYTSSNPKVLTVDAQGNVSILAFGTAVVTVQNGSLKAFSTFVVENSATPLAPQDDTANIGISASGYELNRSTGFFVQTVQLTNSSAVPVVGPLYFLLTNLSSGVTFITNTGGKTSRIPPVGTAFQQLALPDGLTLQPGAAVTLTLQFLDPSRARISYTPKIYRTLGTP